MNTPHLLTIAVGASIIAGVIAAITAGLNLVSSPPAISGPAPCGTPVVLHAETLFFDALNHHPDQRGAALAALQQAVRSAPRDGASNLWLGLCHLWIAAESGPMDPGTSDHALLAEHCLQTARQLLPADDRIIGWLAAAQIALARRHEDQNSTDPAWAELRNAHAKNPCFHGIVIGLLRFGERRDSAEFRQGLEAMRKAADCGIESEATQNRPRWPHNREGFALALAQFELKAGNRQRAETMLAFAREQPEFAAWPHRALVEAQLADLRQALELYNDGDSANDPPLAIAPGQASACRVCHQAAAE